MKTMYVFVLGAPDMEMSAIEDMLLKYKVPYLYAFYKGQRVNASTAYISNYIGAPNGGPNDYHHARGTKTVYVFVECAFVVKGKKWLGHRIDHHQDGDFGYAMGPDKYWEGSSIGQAVDFLIKRCGIDVEVTPKMRYIAASDHCPNAAYRGECAGICKEMLKLMRLEEHSKYNNVGVFDSAIALNNSAKALRRCPVKMVGETPVHVTDVKFAMARDAAMYHGIVVEGVEINNNKEIHYLMGSTTPQIVTQWLKEMRAMPNYDSSYGSPARGYATVSLRL